MSFYYSVILYAVCVSCAFSAERTCRGPCEMSAKGCKMLQTICPGMPRPCKCMSRPANVCPAPCERLSIVAHSGGVRPGFMMHTRKRLQCFFFLGPPSVKNIFSKQPIIFFFQNHKFVYASYAKCTHTVVCRCQCVIRQGL